MSTDICNRVTPVGSGEQLTPVGIGEQRTPVGIVSWQRAVIPNTSLT
jgi:hypothetical protein